MPKRESVRRSLTREAQNAQGRFKTEAEKFNNFVHDLPSMIPYPDSVTRITLAAGAQNEALEAYRTATSASTTTPSTASSPAT
jgi:hypothetical protein